MEALIEELRRSETDLARLVETVSRQDRRLVVLSSRALEAWNRRAPDAWRMVSDWLASRGVEITTVDPAQGETRRVV